ALGSQPQGERQIAGMATAQSLQVLQSCRQSAYRVVAGGAEDKAAQLIPLPLHKQVQSPIQLAALLSGKGAALWSRTADLLHTLCPHASCHLPIPDTQRPAGLSVKGGVFRPQIQ